MNNLLQQREFFARNHNVSEERMTDYQETVNLAFQEREM